jgi:hypothetical protein
LGRNLAKNVKLTKNGKTQIYKVFTKKFSAKVPSKFINFRNSGFQHIFREQASCDEHFLTQKSHYHWVLFVPLFVLLTQSQALHYVFCQLNRR